MANSDREQFSKSKLVQLKRNWSEPDRARMAVWDFDGISWGPEHWMSYDYEMREGLGVFGCKTFDEMVENLEKKAWAETKCN